MKLSQNNIVSQQDRLREIDSFNKKLQRQRIGFGLLTPGFGLPPDGYDANYDHRQRLSGAGSDVSSFNEFFSNQISPIRGATRKAIAFVARSWQAAHARQQQRKIVYNLLSSSDHYLEDIGLNRPELELLLQTNDSLEELIRARRKDKKHTIPHRAQLNSPDHHPKSWRDPELELDRAA